MKNTYLKGLLALILIVFSANTTKANTAAGAELIYLHLGDSTYQFVLKYYIDCGGNAAPDSIPLCLYSPCHNQGFTIKMGKYTQVTNGGVIGPGCPGAVTTCDNPNATTTGYKEYFYTTIATLPFRCSNWTFSATPGTRNASYNLQNSTSQTLYVEATMNNTFTDSINSPYYSVKPFPTAELGSPFSYNNGPLDADGDSLWTSIIAPRTSNNTCPDTPTNIPPPSVNPPYNYTNNPFQTYNTFNLNGAIGQFSFTSQVLGNANLTMRTSKYRNGVLIGSIMRDMQVRVVPADTFIGGSSKVACGLFSPDWTGGKFIGCAGEPLTVCLDQFSDDTSARLFLSDNLQASNHNIQGMSSFYSNQGNDSVRAIYTWTPPQAGMYTFILLLTDSTCRGNGVVRQYAWTVDFQIFGKIEASNDTTICPGDVVFLGVKAGINNEWTILPGGDTGSLSNPWISNPVASPTKTTTYVVTATGMPFCPNHNKDTVTVNVRKASTGAQDITNHFSCGMTDPGVNYIYKCPGEPISFCFSSASSNNNALLYLTNNGSTNIPGANITYFNQGTDSVTGYFSWTPSANDIGFHSITITATDTACVPSGIAAKSQRLDFYIWPNTTTNADKYICPGQSVQLEAKGGTQYQWSVLSGDNNSLNSSSTSSPVAQPDTTTTYVVTSTVNTQCSNNSDTVTVFVYPRSSISHPTVSISISPDSTIIQNTQVTFTASSTGCNNPAYTWYINGTQVPDNYKSSFTSSKLKNLDVISCRLICADTCASPADTFSNTIRMKVQPPITSVNDMPQGSIAITPNPSNGTFLITFDREELTSSMVTVTNTLGQTVYSGILSKVKTQIELHQPAGIYIIKIAKHDKIWTSRLVIQ